MTDIAFKYYNGTSWVDLTPYAKGINVEDYGIQQIPTATLLLESDRSNFADLITQPLAKSVMVQVRPQSTWQTIFYGVVTNPSIKKIAGTHSTVDKVKVLLDCQHLVNKLAKNHVTFDYYALQSATSPYAGAESLTYRKVIEDFIAYPDSNVSLTAWHPLNAETDEAGIDRIIDSSCSWDRQTLLEALRTVVDRIGYDGYYGTEAELGSINIAPYSGEHTSVLELEAPYIGEPEYSYGNLSDIINYIWVWGGVDIGVPTDGDRWTEYGVEKYDPAIWSVDLFNLPYYDSNTVPYASQAGTKSVTDVDNAVWPDIDGSRNPYRMNDMCIKVAATNTAAPYTLLTLNFTDIPNVGSIDAANRVTSLVLNFKPYGVYTSGSVTYARSLRFYLIDGSGGVLGYKFEHDNGSFLGTEECVVELPLGQDQKITDTAQFTGGSGASGIWAYLLGTTAFDWSNIVALKVETAWNSGAGGIPTALDAGFYIDGLHFVGGYSIEPDFTAKNPKGLNPAIYDETPAPNNSILNYGLNMMHHQDTLINSFEQAQAEGARLLANLKDPHGTFTFTKSDCSTTLLRPSMHVDNEGFQRRIAGMSYDWLPKVPDKVKITYRLVEANAVLPPLWTQDAALKRAIK